jgi:hypothetical protein
MKGFFPTSNHKIFYLLILIVYRKNISSNEALQDYKT